MPKIFFALLILLFLAFSLLAYPPGWSDDILLTPQAEGYRQRPDISVDNNNNVWAVWDSVFLGNGYIYYSKRDSLGNCIIPETALPDPQSSCVGNARVVVDGSDNVHIEWTEPSPTGLGIGYAKLDSSGSIIVSPKLAMPGYGGGGNHRFDIALDKYGNINVAWVEQPLEDWQISYTKLDSMGDTLISRIRVSPVGISSIWPGIGVDGMGNIHLGYRTDTIGVQDRFTYSKLDKDGNILISNKVLGIGMIPAIISDRSQNIHMVYLAPTATKLTIKYLKLDQDGNFLISPKIISIHESNNYPHMAMDSLQYLHVVWNLQDPMGVMYAKLDTLGNYVIAPMAVVDTPEAIWPGHPRIAVDRSNRLHLVWQDQRQDSAVAADIYYKRGENEIGVEESKGLIRRNPSQISASPNPFTTSTSIHLPSTGHRAKSIELQIFDVTGRRVKSIKLETGTYQLGTDLVPGVYFLKLKAEEYAETKKIIKIR